MIPDLYWESGEPASIDDPRVKYAIQETDAPAIVFSRKSDAQRYMAWIVRGLKAEGWTVTGKADSKICYRGEESLSIMLTARKDGRGSPS